MAPKSDVLLAGGNLVEGCLHGFVVVQHHLLWTDTCMDMCLDMCTDMCMDICMDMCIGMGMDMCMDI